ncbi:MAG: ATP-binding protein [Candidatus Thorarchaeota archaeon]|jgi:PAS domain S-box-containing protein
MTIDFKDSRHTLFVLLLMFLTPFLMVLIFALAFNVKAQPDIAEAISETPLLVVTLILIIASQRIRNSRVVYIPLIVGCYTILLGTVEDIITEFYAFSGLFYNYSFQDFLWVGYALVTVAFVNWIRILGVTEDRYAALDMRHRDLIGALPEGVVIGELDETITFANKKFAEIIGYELSEVVGKSVLEFVDSTEHERVNSETYLRKAGMSSVYEVWMVQKNGTRRIVRVSAVPGRDKTGKVIGTIAVVSDETDRKRIEEQSVQQKRERELYASLLRHDLGNDLQVVLGYIQAVRQLKDDPQTNVDSMLESAEAVSLRMAHLVKALGTPAESYDGRVVNLLQNCATNAEKSSRGLSITITPDSGTEELRAAGGTLLPMAFDNIFRNAAEHAGENPEVNVRVSEEIGTAVIVISDNGIGIPKDIRKEIFRRGGFLNGRGLGLYLTRQIIKACGGMIEILDQEEASGATFRITLPLLL